MSNSPLGVGMRVAFPVLVLGRLVCMGRCTVCDCALGTLADGGKVLAGALF